MSQSWSFSWEEYMFWKKYWRYAKLFQDRNLHPSRVHFCSVTFWKDLLLYVYDTDLKFVFRISHLLGYVFTQSSTVSGIFLNSSFIGMKGFAYACVLLKIYWYTFSKFRERSTCYPLLSLFRTVCLDRWAPRFYRGALSTPHLPRRSVVGTLPR